MTVNIQEQPESTVGRKPERRPAPPRKGPQPVGPFARYRVRREEAEESDLGGEIRERDEEGPLERGVAEDRAGASPLERKPSVP